MKPTKQTIDNSFMSSTNPLSRRRFLGRTATAAAAALSFPSILSAAAAGNKVRCVQIGCGGRSRAHLNYVVSRTKDHVVALVDPDENRLASTLSWLKQRGLDPNKIQTFTDYRRMFDRIANQFDAVFIATPNHHHALPSMLAMNAGKGVYCEKPLTHDVAEARKLRAMARESKMPTQMGNQGHNEEGYHRLVEYIRAGVIGRVLETYSWTDRANGGEGPRPPVEPVPKGLHWDSWIGPAPYRDYHSDLHPHEWHGWYDFGNGSIGNMGCHVLDGVYWALGLTHPVRIEAEYIRGGSDERYPLGSTIRWDCPLPGTDHMVKVFWYEGLNPTTKDKPRGGLHAAVGKARHLPPLAKELLAKYEDEDFEKSASLYVGEKGIIYTGCYGGRMHIVPWSKMKATPAPPKTLPRPKNVMQEFLDACREGSTKTHASFDYGARLTEFTLLANLAMRAGARHPIEWDGQAMRVKNIPELNEWVQRPYRPGWSA